MGTQTTFELTPRNRKFHRIVELAGLGENVRLITVHKNHIEIVEAFWPLHRVNVGNAIFYMPTLKARTVRNPLPPRAFKRTLTPTQRIKNSNNKTISGMEYLGKTFASVGIAAQDTADIFRDAFGGVIVLGEPK